MGRLFLRPWAYLTRGQRPPLPSPPEMLVLPMAALTYHAVMGRARSDAERQRAAALMLEEDGFPSAEAVALAARMFPGD